MRPVSVTLSSCAPAVVDVVAPGPGAGPGVAAGVAPAWLLPPGLMLSVSKTTMRESPSTRLMKSSTSAYPPLIVIVSLISAGRAPAAPAGDAVPGEAAAGAGRVGAI